MEGSTIKRNKKRTNFASTFPETFIISSIYKRRFVSFTINDTAESEKAKRQISGKLEFPRATTTNRHSRVLQKKRK